MSYRCKSGKQRVSDRCEIERNFRGFLNFKRGVLFEAMGPGFKNFIKAGDFRGWFTKGRDALLSQAQRQVAAANGKPIQWHVAEKEMADALKNLFNQRNVSGISIVISPFIR